MAITLPRLNTGWDSQPGLFERFWNTAMSTIETNINSILVAQTTADGAQGDATTAQGMATAANVAATAAQTDATSALTQVATKVTKDVGPTWAAPSGATSRLSYAKYISATISNPPTQAEVQAVSDELALQSSVIVALITDLRDNHSLTN